MKQATLRRFESTDEGTFGVLSFGDNTLFSLELPHRDNRRMVSSIVPGNYKCVWTYSNRFKRMMYLLLDVPGRDAIRIHSANYAGDTEKGFVSQLNGCIAPALKTGVMRNQHGKLQKASMLSTPAVRKLEEWGAGKPFTLRIE